MKDKRDEPAGRTSRWESPTHPMLPPVRGRAPPLPVGHRHHRQLLSSTAMCAAPYGLLLRSPRESYSTHIKTCSLHDSTARSGPVLGTQPWRLSHPPPRPLLRRRPGRYSHLRRHRPCRRRPHRPRRCRPSPRRARRRLRRSRRRPLSCVRRRSGLVAATPCGERESPPATMPTPLRPCFVVLPGGHTALPSCRLRRGRVVLDIAPRVDPFWTTTTMQLQAHAPGVDQPA